MNISDFDYPLPDERIAKFPAAERDSSKLLVWRKRAGDNDTGGEISETIFSNIGSVLPPDSLLVFNNTRVVRARLAMFKPTGARIEILCLEPVKPADYERAFAARGSCEWSCMVGGLKKWKDVTLEISFTHNDKEHKLSALRAGDNGSEQIVRFEWNADLSWGELLEKLGRVPIPPYLGRDSAEIDNTRYQTVYSRFEGSVAAPTAGLHFTPELIAQLGGTKPSDSNDFCVKSAAMQRSRKICEGNLLVVNDRANFERKEAEVCFSHKIEFCEVTLHVGAGTFLPVKTDNALEHPMHTEHFEVTLSTIEHLIAKHGKIIAVGTTSVRTLESLVALGWRISQTAGAGKGSGKEQTQTSGTKTGLAKEETQTGGAGKGKVQTSGAETGSPETAKPIGQFELRDIPASFTGADALHLLADYLKAHNLDKIAASTRIMITPGFRFRIVYGIITNFHQPKSTLLLLVSAFVGGGRTHEGEKSDKDDKRPEEWRKIYDYALSNGFRFLSYGDSSILLG